MMLKRHLADKMKIIGKDGSTAASAANPVPVEVENIPHVIVDTMPTVAVTIGEVEIKNDAGNPVPVAGPLTNIELRATAVPVTVTNPTADPETGLGTEATLEAIRLELLEKTKPADQQHVIVDSMPSVGATGAATPASATLIGGSDGTDLYAQKTNSEGESSVVLGRRKKLSGLSDIVSLVGATPYVTSWVRVDDVRFLDFVGEIGAAHALSATIEFTDAADPNTTPPGANDISIPKSATIGGTGLGAPDNFPTFAFQAIMTWARLTITSLTGSQTFKVSCFGLVVPPTGAIFALATTVKSNYGAPLSRAALMGQNFDDSTEFVNAKIRKNRLDMADSYNDMDVLDDYTFDGTEVDGIHEFTFGTVVDLIQLHAVGGEARATSSSQTPTATHGSRCPDDLKEWLPFRATSIKVYAAGGTTVTVTGWRYT